MSVVSVAPQKKAAGVNSSDLRDIVVAHTGLEPVVSALRGQRVSRLHQCAVVDSNYRCATTRSASLTREDWQICLPGADGVSVLLRHHANDLADVAQIVDNPRCEQLTERYWTKFRMQASLVQQFGRDV